ncbi:hypothetical protein [Chitinophaga sp. OAE865]|uniref:hypothetical protein n=1 Tax=Chitinophaga sp. OAE865 TaxID=2817898 RepID=UPI001AE9DC6B
MNPLKHWLRKMALFIVSLMLGYPHQTHGQRPLDKVERIIPPDPEAGNLGRYGNYNLNLSSGQVDISIPLHEVSGIRLKYPLSLSYDHKGIRVQERATSAGMNWNFNAASVITRTVNGLPDDRPSLGYNDNYQKVTDALSVPAMYSPTSMITDPLYKATTGLIDLSPDEFSFTINGRSGKFYYDPANGQYYTMPYSKLSIRRINSPESFEVTDEEGFQYIFDRTSELDYHFISSGGENESNGHYTSQWYLTRILGPDGAQEFEFSYVDDQFLNQVPITSYSQAWLVQANAVGSCSGNYSPIMINEGGSTTYNTIDYHSLLISEIRSSLERVAIKYKPRSDQSLALDSVLIQKNNLNNFGIKHAWKFYQSYYSGAGKLRLDSLSHFMSGEKIGGYQLSYIPGQIPNQDSKAIDHWGFYNGANNTTLFPYMWYGSQYIGSANREPSISTANGILKTITYPTGGTTEFEFELNDYGSMYNPSGGVLQPVSQPIYTNFANTVIRRTTTDGAGSTTYSFTLDTTTVVRFDTKRDNCNGNPPNGGNNCTIEPCMTQMIITKPGGATINISGPVVNPQTQFLELNPGTYTLTISTAEALDYGYVYINYKKKTGYTQKLYSGGLRVKRIKNFDAFGGVNIKRFSYLDISDPNRSSGVIQALPLYTFVSTTWADCNTGSTLPGCNSQRIYLNLSSNSNTPITFSDGSTVGYSRVIEYDGENGEGGYIDHRFSMAGDATLQLFPYPAATSNQWKRGLPIHTLYFNKDDRIIKEEIKEYTFDATDNFHEIKGAKGGFSSYCAANVTGTKINFGFTNYNSQWFYLSKEKTLTYPDDNIPNPVVEEINYSYSPLSLLPISIRQEQSDGSIKEIRKKYTSDYSTSPGSIEPMANALNKMLQKNMLNNVIEEVTIVNRDGIDQVQAAILNTFKEFKPGKIYPWQIYSLELEQPNTGALLSWISNNVFDFDNRFVKKLECNAYNYSGKLTEAVDQTNIPYTIIYDLTGVFPMAYVKNAKSNQIQYNGFEDLASSPTISQVKFGRYANYGTQTIPGGSLIPGEYLIGWWKYNGSDWEYKTNTFYHNGITDIVGGDGSIMDELSVRPASSQLNTFTFNYGIGLTSKTQDNGYGYKCDFDLLGRLIFTKDHNDNIIKGYIYKSQGPQ